MSVITTAAGQAKLAASASLGGAKLQLTHMAFGDGSGSAIVPDENMTALVNEVYRTGLQSAVVDPAHPNWLVCRAVIPEDEGPFTIREVGLFDAEGDLIAVSDYPDTLKLVAAQGVDTALDVELIMIISDTANITVALDPNTYATMVWVDENFARKPNPLLFISMI